MRRNNSLEQAIADSKFSIVMECGIKIGKDENGSYHIVFANDDKVRSRRHFTKYSAILTNLDTLTEEDLYQSANEEWQLPKDGHFTLEVTHYLGWKILHIVQSNSKFYAKFEFKSETSSIPESTTSHLNH